MKRILNIVKYLLFLGIGVGLFYLATLDITRGSLVMETPAVDFEVGSGYGDCEGGQILQFSPVSDRFVGTSWEILDGKGYLLNNGQFQGGEDDVEICLPAGSYSLHLPAVPDGSYRFVLKGVNRTTELLNDMKRASIPGIALSFIFGYLAIVSRGIRWRYMLEPMGYEPKRWNSIHAVAFGYFANTFVPRSGELARCAALNQTDDIPVDRLFGTVISERVVDMMMLLLFMSVALLTNLEAFTTMLSLGSEGNGAEGGNNVLTYLMVAMAIGVVLVVVFRRTIKATKLFRKAIGFIQGVGDGLKSVLKMRRKGAFLFHTAFIWSMYFAMAYVIYMSIDATSHMTVFESLFVMVAGGFGMVLPAPGGIGSYHWTVKLGFIALGMSGALGFAVANVMWLTQTVMIIIGGGIGYLLLMFYRIRRDRKTAHHA